MLPNHVILHIITWYGVHCCSSVHYTQCIVQYNALWWSVDRDHPRCYQSNLIIVILLCYTYIWRLQNMFKWQKLIIVNIEHKLFKSAYSRTWKKAVNLITNLTISNQFLTHRRALYRNRVSSWQSHCFVVTFLFDCDVIYDVNNWNYECDVPPGSETCARNIRIDDCNFAAFIGIFS